MTGHAIRPRSPSYYYAIPSATRPTNPTMTRESRAHDAATSLQSPKRQDEVVKLQIRAVGRQQVAEEVV